MASEPETLEVFYDGGCSICRRQVAALQRRDVGRRLRCIDIDDPAFDPAALGRTRAELMAQIHARLPDGSWVTGVEVLRQLEALLGRRWLARLSRLPGIAAALDAGYRFVARHRPRSGRPASPQRS